MDEVSSMSPPEPPRGFKSARVDEKGRLKLPAEFHQYLSALGETKVFITSLDLRTARIYPISLWKENEKFFERFQGDPDALDDVWFVLNDLGGDSDVDAQGRVLVPKRLRERLPMENQPVQCQYNKGRIDFYTQELYEKQQAKSYTELPEKARRLMLHGLR